MVNVLYDPTPSAADINRLSTGIYAEAHAKGYSEGEESFAFWAKDDLAQIIGGAVGFTFFGTIFTQYLWIHADYRHKGHGGSLMSEVETLGREKGCCFAGVNTMSFQARTFFEKVGYFVEFERQGYSNGASYYYLRRNL